jgi:hypothetical protein
MSAASATPAPARENLLLNLACNIAAPALILGKLSKPERLGPEWALVVALAFPLGYFLYDYARRRQANVFSIIGFVSTLLTGGLGLMKVGGFGFAIKEAAMPLVLGAAVLITQRTKRPLVRELVYNPQVLDTERVSAELAARGQTSAFERLLASSAYFVAGSFLVSAALNFGLARWVLTADPHTQATLFNEQLGRMNWLTWPVITLPSMAMLMFVLFRLLGGIKRLTGLDLEQVMRAK